MNSAGGMFEVLYGKRFVSELAWAIRTEGDRLGAVQSTETSCEGSRLAPTCLWRRKRQSVPKRRHLKFRRRGITQKKA